MSRRSAVVGRRGGPSGVLAVAAGAAGAAGVALIVVAVAAQVRAPQPPRAIGRIDPPGHSVTSEAPPGSTPRRPGSSGVPAAPTPLAASRPLRITIPAIGVRSSVRPIGLAADGTLAVPQPGPDEDRAAWFRNSPTPGQPGPAVIEGHVDTTHGPSVFFRLGAIRPGNRIHVRRSDDVEVTFTVDAVRDYKKSAFPTDLVYGAKDLSRPELRLITCSNFDRTIHHHIGNEIVFAHLTDLRRPNGA
jgi:hypothetical protein